MRKAITILATCVAALLALGMVMLYSASMTQKGSHYLVMQLAWCAVGLVACVLAASLDYHLWRKISLPLLGFSCILLTLVFVPGLGRKINGAYRWVELGPLRFQPSELAKIATILSLAAYAAFYQRQMGRFKTGLLFPGLGLLAVLVLIFAGRDYGTTMLLAAVSFMMLVVAGAKIRYVMPFLLIGVLALGYMMWHNPTRRDRLMAWFHPEQYLDGTGYQAYQAKIALGSGGVDGLGLGNGRQKLGFVPEHHTDFIFSIIGEELGLVATMGVVLAFITIVICGTLIAWRARDPFGVYLASGITFLIGLQAFINIGVVTSVLPNKGLPLPFISYGGSNLLLMLFSMGLLLSVARQANEPVPMPDDPFAPETANVS